MNEPLNDSRTARILLFLSKNSSLTAKDLAEKLVVSERTIRNDIRQLERELKDCAAIVSDKGQYSLHILDDKRFQKISVRLLTEPDFFNSPRSRMDYIFEQLMRASEPLLTDDLAYEMSTGRTTVVSDLKKLREELEPYHLSVIGKTSKGLLLNGLESNIRFYILDKNYNRIYQQYPLEPEVKAIVTSIFSTNFFEKSTQEIFQRFLTLMLDRFLTGHFIGPLSASYYNLTARPEFAVIDRMMEQIRQVYQTEFPIEEKLFVLLPVIGMRTPADIRKIGQIVPDEDVRDLMEEIFLRIRLKMEINIDITECGEEFLYHLMFMLNRLRYHVWLHNPLLDDLQSKYPLAWKMAGIASETVTECTELEVTEDEQGYLASYFGVFLEEHGYQQDETFRVAVVCGTGRVTARLIAAQLKKVLDSSAELTLFSSEHIDSKILNEYDIILTTVDLDYISCQRPIIRIQEIFNEQELRHKIEKARYWDQIDVPVLDNNSLLMASLLDESRFFLLKDVQSYEEAVTQMVASLEQSGQVDAGFLERLRQREAQGTMVFDHAIAIPHSVQYAGDKLVLAIGILPESLPHQEQTLRLIFLLALPEQSTSDDGLLIRVYDEIISITRDSALFERIIAADSFSALLRTMYRRAD